MAERQTHVETVKVEYVCDECGIGFMRPTGMMLASYPAQYPHDCSECKARKNFHKSYPCIEYRSKE